MQAVTSIVYDAGTNGTYKQTISRITIIHQAVLPMRLGVRVQACTATVGHCATLL